MNEKILILKNDRAGDLFTSLKVISTLILLNRNITLYLSELNIGFSFLFKNIRINKTNFNLSILNKANIFFDIFFNKYHKIYILSPKSFYFFLPLIFKNIKFYAIVYNSGKKNRPSVFLRKFLYKYKIIYRNKINYKSYRDLQLELLESDNVIDHNYSSLNIPKIPIKLKKILPKKFLLFQFRAKFFTELGWGISEFNYLIYALKKKYKFILFSSDIENNKSTDYFNQFFIKNFSLIKTNKNLKIINKKNLDIFYLDKIDSINLFFLLKESSINLAKEGIYSHISYFHKKKCHNLFNFPINTIEDVNHQKISYSEWCKGMNYKFSFLNSDIKKAVRKILKNI